MVIIMIYVKRKNIYSNENKITKSILATMNNF